MTNQTSYKKIRLSVFRSLIVFILLNNGAILKGFSQTREDDGIMAGEGRQKSGVVNIHSFSKS
ncbi:hypothetical protein AU490_02150 [Lonsdalea populi]|uniref:Uncharacterized protein n=2 Tax=Lonsdalea TaxID=1082702 RepID=A0ACD1JFK3_9GAMM|nr:hypothetical protein AU499_03065 [Lonsdalea populi]RAT15929.1 hypothetical protein AU485_02310 [Lonsdalea quercina]RAT18774.1 hypothetical protein AU486_00420 [Lonsdalea quercina]RAT23519.1 hypothetical protein AU487_00910 [Lonsdalea populi]RAT26191.1 hypothetical protein AU488_04250 [Lonsdalea populi]